MRKAFIIGFLVLASLVGFRPQRINADAPIIAPTVDQYISNIFGKEAKVAKAVLQHESNLRLDEVGYNCTYDGKSKPCKKEDRQKAWSVDCSIGQINVRGTTCPPELMTLRGNMAAVKKIYKEQGLNAWVSFKTGAYKKFL